MDRRVGAGSVAGQASSALPLGPPRTLKNSHLHPSRADARSPRDSLLKLNGAHYRLIPLLLLRPNDGRLGPVRLLSRRRAVDRASAG
jgi:hypothetical protein